MMLERTMKEATSEKRIKGYRWSDLIGIAIMVVPFMISIHFNISERSGFLGLSKSTISIRPEMVSMFFAVVFYASLIARYEGIFRRRSLFDLVVSSARAFLNCWVIAALIGIALPSGTKLSTNDSLLSIFLKDPESILLLFAILFSWLGIKAVAGYSWILVIAAAWKNLFVVSNRMGMQGAIFVISIAVSMALQIRDYSELKDFMREFRGSSSGYLDYIREEIDAATDHATGTARKIGRKVDDFARNSMSDTKLNMEALDLNKDGVVDMEDFKLLYQREKDIDGITGKSSKA